MIKLLKGTVFWESIFACIIILSRQFRKGMTKYRKGPQRTTKDPQRTAKEHYTGPQRIGNHEKTARLATILFNFLQIILFIFCNFVFFVFFL